MDCEKLKIEVQYSFMIIKCDTFHPIHICTNNKMNKNTELINNF